MVQRRENLQAKQLSYHQGSELAHSKISIISEWLGHMKGPALLFQSWRVSVTQGSNRITGRSHSQEPVLMVSQRLEISHQTNDSFQ